MTEAVKEQPKRTNRTLLDYRPVDEPKGKRLRLYIRDGIVVNPKTDADILAGIQSDKLHAVRLRRTREPIRILTLQE